MVFVPFFAQCPVNHILKDLRLKNRQGPPLRGVGGARGGNQITFFLQTPLAHSGTETLLREYVVGRQTDTPQTDLGWSLLPVTIVEFSRLFKIQ